MLEEKPCLTVTSKVVCINETSPCMNICTSTFVHYEDAIGFILRILFFIELCFHFLSAMITAIICL